MNTLNLKKINEKEFIDVPNSLPEVKVNLDKAGVKNRPHYFTILDQFSKKKTRFLGNFTIFFNLPKTQRGLHMSRIERSLQHLETTEELTLQEYGKTLVEHLLELQQQDNYVLELSFHQELLVL